MLPDLSRRANPAELTEWMDEPCSREEMRACLRDLEKVNRWFLAYRPLLSWLDSVQLDIRAATHAPIRIVDVGCGYGDGLRRIHRWAQKRHIAVELTGCDLNADAVAIAADIAAKTIQGDSRISFIAADVFSLQASFPIDIVVSSLFTHHLSDGDIVRFLRWMEANAQVGWFINDLSRAAIPYWLFKGFARVAGLHRFVQHDGPVSIARAFSAEDWRRMCRAAGLGDRDVSIEGFAPARLCVGRTKQ